MRHILYGFLLLTGVCFALGAPQSNTDSLEQHRQTKDEPDLTLLRYLLWTRANSGDDDYYVLEPNNSTNLKNSNFNQSEAAFVLHPGWGGAGTTGWILNGKTNLLERTSANIISVDWGMVVDDINYDKDVDVMYEVAILNAEFLDWLIEETDLGVLSLELTGHSLGAHSVGMTAVNMKSRKPLRITGLDPAGPEFYNKNITSRLDKSQADYVDIIHSNGCSVSKACYGIGQSIGHADFRPNGGQHQPACSIALDSVGCSHDYAPRYWVESIAAATHPETMEQFKAWRCNSWEDFTAGLCTSCDNNGCVNMGYLVNPLYRGEFYLSTNETSPYALGEDQGI